MSVNYVKRKISKNQSITIIPPTLEEILSDDFDYTVYIEKCLNTQIDYIQFRKIYKNIKTEGNLDSKSKSLLENFETQIIEIQRQYENDLTQRQQTIDYNREMKKIAQAYLQKIQASIFFQLQKEREFQALTAKRQELISVLKQMLQVKSKIENQAETRLQLFIEQKIPFGKLYVYDLIKLQNTEIYKRYYRILSEYRRQLFAHLLDEEGAYYKPIEQLHIRGKKS